MKKIFFIYFLWLILPLSANKADLIIFSFDRPLQLYAFLESAQRYITNLGEIRVLYRASNERYNHAYDEVFMHFRAAIPVRQGNQPKADFKHLTIQSFLDTPHEYLFFAVDDIIVKDYVDCSRCIEAMEKSGAYGFYLRLGKNITYCYMRDKLHSLPTLRSLDEDMHTWSFKNGSYDWAYPHTVDMTLYRKKDIAEDIFTMPYQNPSSLELMWSRVSKKVMAKQGLCYAESKIVNIPINRVQSEFVKNRCENSLSTQELLELFEQKLKIDIAPIHTFHPNSSHAAYTFTFMRRE